MAKVNQRLWKIPGQRTKRKAWGFTAQINGKQVRRYKAEWTQDDAEAELAKALLEIEPARPKGPGITLAQAADRYLATKARKRTIEADRRQLDLLKAEFGEETPLTQITASRISGYKAKRLAAVRKVGEGETAFERRLTAAAVNRPLALLRHLLRLAHEEWEAIENVPRIRLEKEPQGRLRWLTEERMRRITGGPGTTLLLNCRAVHGSAPNKAAAARPLLLPVYSSADSFPYTPSPIPSPHQGDIVRGKPARFASFDTRPVEMPPDWRGGYKPVWMHKNKDETPY